MVSELTSLGMPLSVQTGPVGVSKREGSVCGPEHLQNGTARAGQGSEKMLAFKRKWW